MPGQLVQTVRKRLKVQDHLAGDRLFESAPFGVAGADQSTAGLAQLAGATAQLLHLG